MRFIIYGYGKFFHNRVAQIPLDQVTAIVDKSVVSPFTYQNIPVYHPSIVTELSYDYIVILSNQYFDVIREELRNTYFLEDDKILSWTIWLEEQNNILPMCEFAKRVVKELHISSVLDVGMPWIHDIYRTKESFVGERNCELHGVGTVDFHFQRSFYDTIFSHIKKCPQRYEIAFLWDYELVDDNVLKSYSKYARWILLFSKYEIPDQRENIYQNLYRYGTVNCFPQADRIAWLLDTEQMIQTLSPKDVKIYVVTHKLYRVLQDEMYCPLCVGNYQQDNFLSDKMGKNISYLNEKINECTALYWIWKNTDSTYVGLNHYRRYFYNNGLKYLENYLRQEMAEEILENYDIILPESKPFVMTVRQHLQSTIPNMEAYKKGYQIISDLIDKRQPEYKVAFNKVMSGQHFFICNMFVTKREILNSYCEWLFSFLIEAAEKIDVSMFDAYSKRVIGFFAERMWTVWLMKQELKIKEMPITSWE